MREYELQAGGRDISLILPDSGVTNAVYMPCVSSERRAFASAFSLADTALIIPDTDWNRDMSPWPSKRVFRGGEDFTGGAPEFLQILCGDIIPAAERFMGAEPETRAIAGYSLAGLFAVWAILIQICSAARQACPARCGIPIL